MTRRRQDHHSVKRKLFPCLRSPVGLAIASVRVTLTPNYSPMPRPARPVTHADLVQRRAQHGALCGTTVMTHQKGSVMSAAQLYDTIGAAYPVTRRTEPRIAARIWTALGDARTILNVGAGTGSYEPPDRHVLAVEPSALMRSQRFPDAAPCLIGSAENLPFEDQSFDAAMAVSTVHHWQDPIAGLREMRRVARRVVVFTHDTSDTGWLRRFWLTRDYLPEVADLLVGRPSLAEQARAIGARMDPVLIPWDCADGFFEAYWRRPEAYLDENVRRGVSVWTRVGPDVEQRAVHSLRDDLTSGRWAERNRDLVDIDAAELGLRLLVA
jgi:SAM-dependent methyltransferase